MPAINVVFYQEKPGNSPVVGWLRTLNETNPRAFDKCREAISDSHFLVTNFVDPKPTTCETTFMSYVFDWDRSITASFTSFMDALFQSSPKA